MADPKSTLAPGPQPPEKGPTEKDAPDSADKIIEFGEMMARIGKLLKPLQHSDRVRVIKTVATWYDIDLRGGV